MFGKTREALRHLEVPQSSVGAPLPSLLANEDVLFVCYPTPPILEDVDAARAQLLHAPLRSEEGRSIGRGTP